MPNAATVEIPPPLLVVVGIVIGGAVVLVAVVVVPVWVAAGTPVTPLKGVLASTPAGSASATRSASTPADVRMRSDRRLITPNITGDGP
jgi:hypothetical protein